MSKIAEIRSLIGNNKLPEAIIELQNYSQNLPTGYSSEIVLHLSRLNSLEKDERKGIVSMDDIRIQRARVIDALLGLLDIIEKDTSKLKLNKSKNDKSEPNKKDDDTYYDILLKRIKNNRIGAWIILISVVLAFIIGVFGWERVEKFLSDKEKHSSTIAAPDSR